MCQCVQGYIRNSDGRCYQIQCQPSQVLDQVTWTCKPRCQSNSYWDNNLQRCIPNCGNGYVYDSSYNSCVPVCQQNYQWNGRECACVRNCPIVCPPGTYLDPTARQCLSCPDGMILNGNTCVCPAGQDYVNGGCRLRCQTNSDWVNNRCVCRQGYF